MNASEKIKQLFIHNGKWISLFTTFLSLMLVFAGGLFHSSASEEKIAEYASSVVVNNTDNKKYCTITVQKTSNSGSIADSYSEFNNLYGVFKQTKVTFASAMNMFDKTTGDKEHDIRIEKENDILSDNLSFFYLGPCGSMKNKSNQNTVGQYRHYVYPLETMFSDDSERGKTLPTHYIAYISQSHANKILEKNGIEKTKGKYSENQYKSLLGEKIQIQIDDNKKADDFVVMNIYLENKNNYYFNGLKEVLGDFIAVSYDVPNNLRQEQKNIYFLSEYTYQNRYFMTYINTVYSSKTFDIRVNHLNIKGDIDDNFLLSFYYSDLLDAYDWLSVLMFVFAAVLLLVSVLFVISSSKSEDKDNKFLIVLNFIVAFIPFLLFWIVFKISGNLIFMSEISSKINGIYLLIFISFLFAIFILKKNNLLFIKNYLGEDYYEVDV